MVVPYLACIGFTLSIRYMNQINFMINVPVEWDPFLSPDFIARTLDMGMVHYTLGMRAYYLSVVAIPWLFGPVWMFLGSLVFVLHKPDHCRAPDYSSARCHKETHGLLQQPRFLPNGNHPAACPVASWLFLSYGDDLQALAVGVDQFLFNMVRACPVFPRFRRFLFLLLT